MSKESVDAHADRKTWHRLLLAGIVSACVVSLTLAPIWLNFYWMRVFSYVFMYATLAQALNLIAGYTGYPAFGNVVFFGIGAYATAILMTSHDIPFHFSVLVATGICMTIAVAFGPSLLRLQGHYFAIATVGFNEATRAVVENTSGLTGGGMGLSVPLSTLSPASNALLFYYLLFALVTLSVLVTGWFSISRLGHACRAVRDNESKAEAMGLRTTRIKTIAWTISAMFTGAVGGVHAYWLSYIEPSTAFDMSISVKSFVIFLLGGAGTVFGPVIAAAFVELFSTLTWSYLLSYHLGLMGLIIILVVMYIPNGFGEFVRDRRKIFTDLFRLGRILPGDPDRQTPRS